MVTVGVCLETVFPDLPVEQRIGKIAAAGYQGIEFWHPEGTWDGRDVNTEMAKDADELRQACQEHGVTLSDFAMHAWDGSIGGWTDAVTERTGGITADNGKTSRPELSGLNEPPAGRGFFCFSFCLMRPKRFSALRFWIIDRDFRRCQVTFEKNFHMKSAISAPKRIYAG